MQFSSPILPNNTFSMESKSVHPILTRGGLVLAFVAFISVSLIIRQCMTAELGTIFQGQVFEPLLRFYLNGLGYVGFGYRNKERMCIVALLLILKVILDNHEKENKAILLKIKAFNEASRLTRERYLDLAEKDLLNTKIIENFEIANKSLQEKCQTLEDTALSCIQQYKATTQQLIGLCETGAETIDQLKEVIDELKQLNSMLEDEVKYLTDNKHALSAEIGVLKRELTVMEAQDARKSNEIKALTDEKYKLLDNLMTMGFRVNTLSEKSLRLSSEIARLSGSLGVLEE